MMVVLFRVRPTAPLEVPKALSGLYLSVKVDYDLVASSPSLWVLYCSGSFYAEAICVRPHVFWQGNIVYHWHDVCLKSTIRHLFWDLKIRLHRRQAGGINILFVYHILRPTWSLFWIHFKNSNIVGIVNLQFTSHIDVPSAWSYLSRLLEFFLSSSQSVSDKSYRTRLWVDCPRYSSVFMDTVKLLKPSYAQGKPHNIKLSRGTTNTNKPSCANLSPKPCSMIRDPLDT